MRTKILADIQICISVPLTVYLLPTFGERMMPNWGNEMLLYYQRK